MERVALFLHLSGASLRARARTAFVCLLLACGMLAASPASAANCSPAGSPGAAPTAWQTYCWLDMASYNDTLARGAGQNFSLTLGDGSTLSFLLKTTSTTTSGAVASSAPSWSGAAVGNSSFLSIPGKPILYMKDTGAKVTFTFSNITVTPPAGTTSVSTFSFVVADGESTDNSEWLRYTTNGGGWQLLDSVAPISGNQMPVYSGVGTSVFNDSGGGQTGYLGAHITGTANPSQVKVEMQGSGLEGVMFAVRFASIKLNKTITGTRIDPTDQFRFLIEAQGGGATYASGVTTGSGNGPFNAAVLSTSSGIPLVLREEMVAGSASALSDYYATLTCTNANAGSTTVLPTGVATSSYNFGALEYGDFVSCTFNNAAWPTIELKKQLATAGRIFATDQFTLRTRNLTAGTTVAQVTTAGTGNTITNGTTGKVKVTPSQQYRVEELPAGTTDLARYTGNTSCTNAWAGSPTALPGGAQSTTFTPVPGDRITCTIVNTRGPSKTIISIAKASQIISDPTGQSNPKMIPGAIVEYTVTVTNAGDAAVDANTLSLSDVLPAQVAWQTSFAPTLTDGATPSGLNPYNASTMTAYSDQPGGSPYGYTPAPSIDGTVTGVRFKPTGSMAASNGTNHPSFTIRYRVQVK